MRPARELTAAEWWTIAKRIARELTQPDERAALWEAVKTAIRVSWYIARHPNEPPD